jgi:signal transduction histidine kinase
MKAKRPFMMALAGGILGYIVLSPFAMYISHVAHLKTPTYEMAVWDVFSLDNLFWSLSFTAFGAAAGLLVGVLYCRQKCAVEELKKYSGELEEANRLKDLLGDIMHHDLLNPTGVILNLTEILAEDENMKDTAKLAVIKRNALKLEDMINNAYVFGKIESSHELEKERLELGEIVKTAIKNLETYAPEKEAKIEFVPDKKYELRVNSVIVSALENLISNAIKYGPVGQDIKITIDDAGDNLKVIVADQGEGIPDKFKEAIFDRFTREDKVGVKGTGLGLAITKRIVELHDGRVWVEDNPEGKGSVFFVSLPKN